MASFEGFCAHLDGQYQIAKSCSSLLSPALVHLGGVPLPTHYLRQAEGFVRAAWQLRQSPVYQEAVLAEAPGVAQHDPGNFGALMSYDFHLSVGDPSVADLKLIEINTNAAFSLVLAELSDYLGLEPTDRFRAEILRTFAEEAGPISTHKQIRIVDDRPREQKLFIEFLLYDALFRSHGWNSEIQDSSQPLSPGTLVYNRDTDFYLAEARTRGLREGYLGGDVRLTPNPHEYALLADKQRLLDWNENLAAWIDPSSSSALTLRRHLLRSVSVKSMGAEAAWADRKNLFFKPRASFGGKAVYRGKSISRRLFEELILQGDYIAQEFAPAPEMPINGTLWKYDIRFYAYKDRIQMAGVRLFQGQVTNFQNPGGGFAPIRWES